MHELGLVDKRALTEPYRPVAYTLTPRGKKIAALVEEIEKAVIQ
jgi:DNA-binding HxlR family transcriptional regulator